MRTCVGKMFEKTGTKTSGKQKILKYTLTAVDYSMIQSCKGTHY